MSIETQNQQLNTELQASLEVREPSDREQRILAVIMGAAPNNETPQSRKARVERAKLAAQIGKNAEVSQLSMSVIDNAIDTIEAQSSKAREALAKDVSSMTEKEREQIQHNLQKLSQEVQEYRKAKVAVHQAENIRLTKSSSVTNGVGDALAGVTDKLLPTKWTKRMKRYEKIGVAVVSGAAVAYGTYKLFSTLFSRGKDSVEAGKEAAKKTKGGLFKKLLVGLGVGGLAFGSYKLYELYKKYGSMKKAMEEYGRQIKEGGEIIAEKTRDGIGTVKEGLLDDDETEEEKNKEQASVRLEEKATQEYFEASFPFQYDIVEDVLGKEVNPEGYVSIVNELVQKALLQDVRMKSFLDCVSDNDGQQYVLLLKELYGSDFESLFSNSQEREDAINGARMLVLLIQKNQSLIDQNIAVYGAPSAEELTFEQALNFSKGGLGILQEFAKGVPKSFLEKFSASPASIAELFTDVPNIDFSTLANDTSVVAIQGMFSGYIDALPATATEAEKIAYTKQLQKDATIVSLFFTRRDKTRISTIESELAAVDFPEGSQAKRIIEGVLKEVWSSADGSIQKQLLAAMLVPLEGGDEKDVKVERFFSGLFTSGELTFKEAFDLYYLSKSGQGSTPLLFLRGIELMRSRNIGDHGLILNRYLDFMSLAGSAALGKTNDLAQYGLENFSVEFGNLGKYIRDKGAEKAGKIGGGLGELWDRYKNWVYGVVGVSAAGTYTTGTRYRAVRRAMATSLGEDIARVTNPRLFSLRRLPLIGGIIADAMPGNYAAYRYIDEFEGNGRGRILGSIDWVVDRFSTPSRWLAGNGRRVSILRELATADVDILHARFLKRLPIEVSKSQIQSLQDLAKKAVGEIDAIGNSSTALRSPKMAKVVERHWRDLARTVYTDFKGSVTTSDLGKMIKPGMRSKFWSFLVDDSGGALMQRGSGPAVAATSGATLDIDESTPLKDLDEPEVSTKTTASTESVDAARKLEQVTEEADALLSNKRFARLLKEADIAPDEAVRLLGALEDIDPGTFSRIRGSRQAQNMLVGGLMTKNASEITAVVQDAQQAARMWPKIMKGVSGTLNVAGAIGDVFGIVMAYVDFQRNGERIRETENPYLREIYSNANIIYVADGTTSAAALVYGGVVMYTSGSLAAAGSVVMLPIALAVMAQRSAYHALEDSAEYHTLNENDLLRMSPGKVLEHIDKTGPGEKLWGQTLADMYPTSWFDKPVDWGSANENARGEGYRAYFAQIAVSRVNVSVLDMSPIELHTLKNDPEQLKNRLTILRQEANAKFVMDAVRFVQQETNGTFKSASAETLQRAELYALQEFERSQSEGTNYSSPNLSNESTFKKLRTETYKLQDEHKSHIATTLVNLSQNPEAFLQQAPPILMLYFRHDLATFERRVLKTDYDDWSEWTSSEDFQAYVRGFTMNQIKNLIIERKYKELTKDDVTTLIGDIKAVLSVENLNTEAKIAWNKQKAEYFKRLGQNSYLLTPNLASKHIARFSEDAILDEKARVELREIEAKAAEEDMLWRKNEAPKVFREALEKAESAKGTFVPIGTMYMKVEPTGEYVLYNPPKYYSGPTLKAGTGAPEETSGMNTYPVTKSDIHRMIWTKNKDSALKFYSTNGKESAGARNIWYYGDSWLMKPENAELRSKVDEVTQKPVFGNKHDVERIIDMFPSDVYKPGALNFVNSRQNYRQNILNTLAPMYESITDAEKKETFLVQLRARIRYNNNGHITKDAADDIIHWFKNNKGSFGIG